MVFRKSRGLLAGLGVILTVLGSPSESQAIFHWFRSCAQPAVACNPCAAQTCSYVPQTCYRTQYCQVPVTTYRPVQSCTPCGGQVVTMRPATTYMWQAKLVPYTTYRLSCTASSPCATGACGGTPITVGSPITTVAAPATSSCCGGAVMAAPSLGTPNATPYYQQQPQYQPAPSLPATSSPVPSPGAPSTSPAQQTFQRPIVPEPAASAPEPNAPAVPVPDPTADSAAGDPSTLRLIDPDNRVTRNSAAPTAWGFTPASWRPRSGYIHAASHTTEMQQPNVNAAPAAPPTDDSIWRASNR